MTQRGRGGPESRRSAMVLPMFASPPGGGDSPLMEPVEGGRPKRGLQAAKEPLSLRFLLAFSASTVLTAAVAVPMAFQAHLANEERPRAVVERPDVAVLGTSTVPDD